MPPRDPETGIALLLYSRIMALAFRQLTGMTIDEWDELNYQRIMSEVRY